MFPADTYANAVATCEALPGFLVTIDDVAENTHVLNIAPAGAWIGFNDLATEGMFVWFEPGTAFTSWATGQPNDGGGGTTEDCVAMRADGRWYDEDCPTEVYPFVCQCR